MICKYQVVGRDGQGRFFVHPCGQCLACRINDTRAWYVRSRFEIKKPERPFQYFLTLTYNDESIPENGLCDKKHLKNFLNNLNTSFGLYLRYFATSDYGSINNRCHYHAIILSTKKITQKMVEKIWKKGFVYLKPLADHNLRYVLRYTVKKKPFDKNEPGFFRLISKGWGNNVSQFYSGQDYFVFDGRKYAIPLYLKKKLNISVDIPKTKYYDLLVSCGKHFNYDKVNKDSDDFHRKTELQVFRRTLK